MPRFDRLDQVTIDPQLVAAQDVLFFRRRGEHDHGDYLGPFVGFRRFKTSMPPSRGHLARLNSLGSDAAAGRHRRLEAPESRRTDQVIPVVVLTSSAEEQDVLSSYQLGVNSYLVKPVEFSAFTSVITQTGLYWAVMNRIPNQ